MLSGDPQFSAQSKQASFALGNRMSMFLPRTRQTAQDGAADDFSGSNKPPAS